MTEPEARLFNYLSRFPRLGDLAVEFGTLARRKKSAHNRWVVGQGFKPANVDRLDSDTYHREHSTPVATLPHLPIDHFRLLAGTSRGLRPWKDGVVHRRGFEAGFSGPRVLVPHGIAAGPAGPRLRAAYVDEPLTFQHGVQAITASPGDEHRGRLLGGLLNSRVMLWFRVPRHFVVRLGASQSATSGTPAPPVSCVRQPAGSTEITLGGGCADHP